MQRSNKALATAAVVAGLGGLAAVALTTHPGSDAAATAGATAPPRTRTVRTVEVHTITRVRHDLPPAQPRPAAAAPPAGAAPVAAAAPAPAAATPVVEPAPAAQPLRTRASGSPGSGEGEDDHGGEREDHETEHEGGGHDD